MKTITVSNDVWKDLTTLKIDNCHRSMSKLLQQIINNLRDVQEQNGPTE